MKIRVNLCEPFHQPAHKFIVTIDREDIDHLKYAIYEETKIHPMVQRVICSGKELVNENWNQLMKTDNEIMEVCLVDARVINGENYHKNLPAVVKPK